MVIIVMGVAGAGKTTVGRALASALGWTFIEADDCHPAANLSKLRAGTPLTDADRAPWLATLGAIVSRAIDRREHAVLACSALKDRYRERLVNGRHPVRFVYLQAQEPLVRQRLATRPPHPAGPSIVTSQFADLEEPADALVVDASWSPDRIVGVVRYAFGV